MTVVVWLAQVLLGLVFVVSGIGKLTMSRPKQLERMAYVEDFSAGQMRGIGAVELAGGIGVVLASWTGIAPILSPLAAAGLAVVMVLAAAVHVRRKEFAVIGMNTALFALAVFVAWARFGPYAI